MVITTDNLEVSLRLLAENDAEALCRLVDQNRAHLRQWLPWLDGSTSVEHTREFIKGTIKRHEESAGFVCAICFQSSIVGVVGHNSIDKANRISYPGYWLSQSHTGRGIMTTAVRALIEHAFAELDLNRIDIRVAVGNQKSQGVADRLGFAREGVIRQAEWLYDRFVDHTVNGLLRSSFK
ncbi:MAG: GNAT family protein [Verrucomicrobiota bacterium]